MADSKSLALPSWGDTARSWFWAFFALGPVLGFLDGRGVIDRAHGVWLVVSFIVALGWLASGFVWAFSKYRRRSLN
jgi:uncharacterized membrane protein YhaH (DUF805 family)